MPDGPVAALDCGTNSTRLLITDRNGQGLDRRMTITRLGKNVDATGRLDPAAIDRTLAVLAQYRSAMDAAGVVNARLVATSAARDAANGAEFLAEAGRTVGYVAELLSGAEEGQLAYRGATAGLAPVAGDDVVIDIGGGSTELVLSHGGKLAAVSMQLGCVRVTERCFAHDPPTALEIDDARNVIAEQLKWALDSLETLGHLRPGSRLIGLAGTITTIGALELGLAAYEPERIHHSVLSLAAVEGWSTRLLALSSSERAELPAMVAGREDVIAAGSLILSCVMAELGFSQCLVSESDILDGIAASLLD